MMLSFFVPGLARPKGSKRAIPIYRGKKGQPREFTGHAAVVESAGAGLKAWERDIRLTAAQQMDGSALLEGPIYLDLTFILPMTKLIASRVSKGHPAPPHTIRPDRLKLARAVEDALTGIVWRDDAQVVGGPVTKGYGDPPGVQVRVETIDTEGGRPCDG